MGRYALCVEAQGGVPAIRPAEFIGGSDWIRHGTNQSNQEEIMAWRITDYIVRGEIDNRFPGVIKETLYVEGLR